MKKFLLTLALLSALPAAAQAATIDISLSNLSGGSLGASLTPNVSLLSPSLSLGAGAFVIGSPDPSNPASYSFAAAPSGALYGGNYLAVLGGSSAVATFSLNTTSVGFTWGSIDSYNTLTIKDAANNSFTYTGTELLAAMANLNVTATAGATQADVLFTDPFASIVSATFSSSANSFEVANLSAVPLPGSIGMLALGLLALLAYRRKTA